MFSLSVVQRIFAKLFYKFCFDFSTFLLFTVNSACHRISDSFTEFFNEKKTFAKNNHLNRTYCKWKKGFGDLFHFENTQLLNVLLLNNVEI
jgi:hypothetical protein